MDRPQERLHDLPELRDQSRVFIDRAEAGRVLGAMLAAHVGHDGVVLAIPAGGVPVAAEVAQALGWTLDVAVVSKITPPWNTEIGYGAVAFDGTSRLNEAVLPALGLTPRQIEQGVARTTEKVLRRVELLRGARPWPDLTGREVLVVDDGLASGFTMRLAVEVLRTRRTGRLLVAVPTAHTGAAACVAAAADGVYVANLRGGVSFAVADAYRHWRDVDEMEALDVLKALRAQP